MNHPGKVFLTLTAALLLLCPQIFAQEPSGEAAPPPAEQTDQDEDTNQLLQQFEKAPTLEGGTQKLYHIRNVNIHGAQYIDNSILRASSGLIPGDSIYLPSNFISTAITRLWNQRLFSDIRVGATIEGDSLDLEVFLKERPRVNYWRFEGISKSNQKDLLEKLKLKRGSELSDYVIDKNQKLIRHLFGFFQKQLLFLCFRSGSCLKLHLPGFFYFICLGLICGCPFAAFCCFSRFFRFAAGKSSHFRVSGIFSEFPYQIQGCGYAQNADYRHSDADTPFDVAPHSPFEFTGPFPQKLSAQNQYHRKIGKHPQQDAFFSFRQFFQFCIQYPKQL